MAVTRFYSSTAGQMFLSGSISNAATSATLTTVTGLPASFPYTLIMDPGLSTEEVVEVTAIGGSVVTIVRGKDGTSGQAHGSGAEVRHGFSARDFQDSRNHENATIVHGATGAVVGTTNVQTLTNKVIDGASNTLSNTLPAGCVMMFGSTTPPSGWLSCDGSSVLRATWPALFAVIGVSYGSVDGSHFTLPNMASAYPYGATPGTTGGEATHVLTASEMPVHTHIQDAHDHTQDPHTHGVTVNGTQARAGNATGTVNSGSSFNVPATIADIAIGSTTANNQTTVATNQNAGSGAAHNNLPPFVGFRFIIKT